MPGFPFGQPQDAPSNAIGSQRPARERVIDVDAQEKQDKSDKKRK